MNKRVLSTMLVLVLALSLLAGCGGSGGASDEGGADSGSAGGNASENTLTIPVSATVTSLNRLLESMAEGWLQLAPFADELYYVDMDEILFKVQEH